MSPDESGGTQLRPQEPAQTPPPEYQSRTKESERTTRKPMQMWDRVKILTLLLGVWGILVWAARVQHPDRPLSEALRSGIWLLVLAELELIRQVHYLICEHWAGYYRFWNKGVFQNR